MVVQTLDRNPGHFGRIGLQIGLENAEEHFPRHFALVEIELDHLVIVCSLEPSFWEGRPEIHDLRLSSWLEAKRTTGKLAAQPAAIALVPCGERCYRLQLIEKDGADRSLVGPPTSAYFAPVIPPADLLDRRKHKTVHKPERRVGKLKGNGHPSSSTNN